LTQLRLFERFYGGFLFFKVVQGIFMNEEIQMNNIVLRGSLILAFMVLTACTNTKKESKTDTLGPLTSSSVSIQAHKKSSGAQVTANSKSVQMTPQQIAARRSSDFASIEKAHLELQERMLNEVNASRAQRAKIQIISDANQAARRQIASEMSDFNLALDAARKSADKKLINQNDLQLQLLGIRQRAIANFDELHQQYGAVFTKNQVDEMEGFFRRAAYEREGMN
jgi:hypothetical protein